jgi:integrase
VRQILAKRDHRRAEARLRGRCPECAQPLFIDAVNEEHIAATPCTLRTKCGELPKKRDADPRWRSRAVYSREEAIALISDPRIRHDRRSYYGLMLLAGLRAGEAHGLRWRDLDDEARPLGRLIVAGQADSKLGHRETKTGAVREIPIHPTLATMLETWRREGRPLIYDRHPRPDELVISAHEGGKPDQRGRVPSGEKAS